MYVAGSDLKQITEPLAEPISIWHLLTHTSGLTYGFHRTTVVDALYRPDGRWRARYRDDADREHARHFDRKIDGQRWLDEVTASVVTGIYVDPGAGRVTFDAYYRTWSERQVWAPMTEVQMDLVRRTVPFGSVSIASLRTSHLEAWVKSMVSAGYAPTTVATRTNAVRAGG